MSPHQLLPLVAFLLNLSLAGITLARNRASRLNRVFAYFLGGLALWNFGVFMLRRAPGADTAQLWEVVIHVALIPVPAFYYHFVLIFLERTTQHRRSLSLAYALTLLFTVANVTGSPLFIKGVTWTYWGWAPVNGPLYIGFFLYLNAFFIWGLVHLTRAMRAIDSSFRRNRARLIQIGTAVTLAGGFIDFTRFILAKYLPVVDQAYPVGIPANMIFALMLGISIVRYRLFNVTVAVKRTTIYAALGVALTTALTFITRLTEEYFELGEIGALWVVLPLGVLVTLLLGPLGQPLEDQIQKLIFSKRRGCYDTLLALSKQMSGLLNFNKLVDTLVQGLVGGIPLTHCVLLVYDRGANAYVPYREQTAAENHRRIEPVVADSPLAEWLKREGSVLVKEEVALNPRIAAYFEAAGAELDEIDASLIVPLKIENNLAGILLLGEKLSGEIFDSQELEVLSVLANQAAISLGNASLYEELGSTNARLLEANQLKSQFLASMSHELRTPLNSIIGFSKVLLNRLDGELTERQDAYIRSVHSSGTHLLRLINDILDFSRIEAGKTEVHSEELDLPDLVAECIESSMPLVRGKPLKLEKELPPNLPRIRADRTKVKQVLLNLLSNAVKFTATGRVVIRAQPDPDGIHVSVADTGIGIREHELTRLFEPFHRLNNPRARDPGGTGLGLAISKKFIEMQGGRIWAESRENQGSIFHFTLPLRRAQS